jgi:hypothetical protein
MRKLLIMLNAILRRQLQWNPEFAFPSPFSAAGVARGGAVILAESAFTA